MKEAKDPEIKLFGRKIALPETAGADESNSGSGGFECDGCSEVSGGGGEEIDEGKLLQVEEVQVAELCHGKDQNAVAVDDEPQNPTMNVSNSDENPKTTSGEEDDTSENHSKADHEQSDAKSGQQKPLKKPDKILPCPRCNSMETKFCYYNNYNVNQPRHFCKSCQRYWTAGGTMRNVPVGAGRRKNKSSTSHCHHITITEAFQATRIDAPNGFHHPAFKPNGCSVLSFGANSLLCDSMASGFNLVDKSVSNGVVNGHHEVDRGDLVSCKNGEEHSVGSSVQTTNSVADGSKTGSQQTVMQNLNGFQSPVPCIPGVPWPFPWNSTIPLPAIYPIPFYPAAPYWNCGLPNAWNIPYLSMPSPTANQKPTSSSPTSPLGKHSRNGELLKPDEKLREPNDSKNMILVPKTLRIDDPEEAAKSSIWETLGIKYDSTTREGLFKALQPKGDEKKLTATPSPALQANPAALSRSITFHEAA